MGRLLLLVSLFFWAGVFGGECLRAEGDAGEITRVNITEYVAKKPVRTADPMIRFERRYLTWGAINSDDYREREGKYFTIFWKTKDPGAATVRFEYLQGKTGKTVHVKEVTADKVQRGTNKADFRVTGAEFHDKGDVLAWKASILRNGVVVADRKSFLWKDP
jgi:hypothetical protein